MPEEVFKSGTFRGVSVHDSFVFVATETELVVVSMDQVVWPYELSPKQLPLDVYPAGVYRHR
jgi:hypothetical protein